MQHDHPLAGIAVLVVDDDPRIRCIIARLLRAAGATVREVGDRDGAIAIAEHEHVDLLLTDVEMPVHDGAAVAAAFATRQPEAAIVYMSGRPQADHVCAGRVPADAWYLAKPFDLDELVDTLATARAARGSRPQISR